MLIKQELYGVDWQHIAATEIENQLEAFQVSGENEQVDSGCHYDQGFKRPIFINAEESLITKQKGRRISNYKRFYLYSLLKKDELSKAMLWMKYSLSPGILRNIEKEFRAHIKKFQLEKSNTSRNLVESPKICDAIRAFLSSHRIPWTANDMWSCLKSKLGITVYPRIVREVWKRILGMKYKNGLSRMVSFDEEMNGLAKQWFTIRIWKSLDQFNVLINIDESSFSRLTKKNYSWIPKGKSK